MKIVLRLLSGEALTMEISRRSKCLNVKQEIKSMYGIPTRFQQLVIRNTVWSEESTETLEQMLPGKVCEETRTIQLIIKPLVCANCQGKVWREETSQDESEIGLELWKQPDGCQLAGVELDEATLMELWNCDEGFLATLQDLQDDSEELGDAGNVGAAGAAAGTSGAAAGASGSGGAVGSTGVQEECGPCGVDRLGSSLKACQRCKQVRYCSKACQAEHWPTHKQDCNAPPAHWQWPHTAMDHC